MRTVSNGDYVKVHYTGKFEDGEVFESSKGCKPVEVHVGSGEFLVGFEDALVGMAPTETKTFSLEASEAYGERHEELEQSFQLSDFPDDYKPEVGQVILLESSNEEQFHAMVTHVGDENVVLDLNHPLAGKALTFEVEVVEIGDQPSPSQCGEGCCCS